MGEFVALRWTSRARFFSEFDRTMLFFSASMPLMCGTVGLFGGGVGGMSPVMLTSASMPALRSLRAATGGILNMSSTWAARVGDEMPSSELVISCSLGSAAGTGRGGGEGTALESLPASCCDVDVKASARASGTAILKSIAGLSKL